MARLWRAEGAFAGVRQHQSNTYTTAHLGPMKGYNAGGKGEIHLTPKWVGEFTTAVNRAHGRTIDGEK